MCLNGLDPVQQAGKGRDDRKADEKIAVWPAALKRADDERAEHGDADVGGNAARAGEDHQQQAPPPWGDETEQRLGGRTPFHPLDPQDCVVRARLAARVMLGQFDVFRRPALDERCVAALAALLRLRAHQRPIGAVAPDQFGMGAALDDAPALEHDNAIGVDHARKPMRQDQRGAALHEAVERALDDRFVLGVDRRERFVENEDRRVA